MTQVVETHAHHSAHTMITPSEGAERGLVLVEVGRQLRQGEDEDEVEEQLDVRDPVCAGAVCGAKHVPTHSDAMPHLRSIRVAGGARSRLTACPSTPCRRRSGAVGGRAGGESGTRDRIIAAAIEEFGELGYDGATMRGIAARAGVDAALLHHYFGTKADLFAETVGAPMRPDVDIPVLLAGPMDVLGERIVRYVLEAWEQPETRKRGVMLLRAGIGNRLATPLLSEFLQRELFSRIAARLDKPDAALRASLVASQAGGAPHRPASAASFPPLPRQASTNSSRASDPPSSVTSWTEDGSRRRKETHDVPGIPRQHRREDGAHASASSSSWPPRRASAPARSPARSSPGWVRTTASVAATRWRSCTSSPRATRSPRSTSNSGGAHSDPSDTLWLDGKATNPSGMNGAARRDDRPLTGSIAGERIIQHVMNNASAPAVEVRDLRVRRGSNQVFAGLQLDIPRGQITGLLGPSGCGKTTLMRSIVGVQKIDGGTVTVLGEPAGTRAQRRRVAYDTQAASVYGDLTVSQNLALLRAAHRGPAQRCRPGHRRGRTRRPGAIRPSTR